MSEQAPPLVATGSIAPGRSIAAMFDLLAHDNQVAVDDRLRQAWANTNNLYTQVDGRLDLDHQDSKPEASPDRLDSQAWQPWFDYLVYHSEDKGSLPDTGDLTSVQRRAFAMLRDSFVQIGLSTAERQQFVASLQQFIDTSQETKQAAIIGTTDGFAKRRTREALAIAHLFTSVVPESARRERFDRFVGNAEHGMQVFKLLDSVVDMGRDSRNGNINIEPTATNRLRLLGRAAMSGLRAGAAVRFDPRLLWRGGLKTLTMIKNRSGKLNAQRTNQ